MHPRLQQRAALHPLELPPPGAGPATIPGRVIHYRPQVADPAGIQHRPQQPRNRVPPVVLRDRQHPPVPLRRTLHRPAGPHPRRHRLLAQHVQPGRRRRLHHHVMRRRRHDHVDDIQVRRRRYRVLNRGKARRPRPEDLLCLTRQELRPLDLPIHHGRQLQPPRLKVLQRSIRPHMPPTHTPTPSQHQPSTHLQPPQSRPPLQLHRTRIEVRRNRGILEYFRALEFILPAGQAPPGRSCALQGPTEECRCRKQ